MPSRHGTDIRLRRRSTRGASLPEVIVLLTVIAIVSGSAWRALGEMGDGRSGREAARGVAADLRRTAQEARRLRRTLAVEFDPTGTPRWRVLADRNGNGVTTSDILAGVDTPHRDWTLVFREGHARLAVVRSVPDADGAGSLPAGSAPVRLGAMPRLIFTPRGTGTAGSIYVAGRGGRMYAIRVLGSTQRVRLLCLSAASRWEGC